MALEAEISALTNEVANTRGWMKDVADQQKDDHDTVIRMEGKGRERRGGGTVTLTMEGTVHELEGGRCEVTVVADIQLAGQIVRFGRGMIQAVTAEIFKEFTACLAAELAAGKPRGEASDGDVAAQPGPAGESGDFASSPAGSSPEALPLLPLLLRSFRSCLRRLFGRE